MAFQFRPWTVPDDLPRIAAIASVSSWGPVTPADLAESLRTTDAEGISHRLAATDPTGLVIAYGSAGRAHFDERGRFAIRVVVAPEHRRQGIGSAMLAMLETWAYEQGATCLETRFRDEPEWFAFALRQGYATIQGRHLGFTLDLSRFDETPFVGVLHRLEAEGIRFLSMADEHTPLLERQLYELERDSNHDEPGFEEAVFPPFEAWHKSLFESKNRPLDCTIVAVDGETPVGMTALRRTGAGDMSVMFTGVHRDYRGRSIALAVKLLSIRAARRHGAARVGTGSDERNGPMLHVNRKMGFERSPGMYWCVKR